MLTFKLKEVCPEKVITAPLLTQIKFPTTKNLLKDPLA